VGSGISAGADFLLMEAFVSKFPFSVEADISFPGLPGLTGRAWAGCSFEGEFPIQV